MLGTLVLFTGRFTIGVNAWLPAFLISTIVFVAGSFLAKPKVVVGANEL